MIVKTKIFYGVAILVITALFSFSATAQGLVDGLMKAAGIPQMDAFLPDKYDVEKTEALPIDGVWRINTISKKIQIDRGRAYALDSWMHMFTLKVQPNMVVMKDFKRVRSGEYTAEDLPLLGPATLTLQEDGNLSVDVQGKLGPVKYTLIKLDIDDEDSFEAELAAMSGKEVSKQPRDEVEEEEDSQGAESDLANCKSYDVDPKTGDVICVD